MLRRFKRTHRSFGVRRHERPARQWLAIPVTNFFAGATTGATSQVLAFEAPTITPGTAVTADPPEDQILDRIVAEFRVDLNGIGSWTVGLMLVDRTWTQSSTGEMAPDGDKRILWYETYESVVFALAGLTTTSWVPPNSLQIQATTPVIGECDWRATHLDITPKVRLEDGKQLVFVAWENSGTATLTFTTRSMRILMHRAGRR